MCLIFQLGIKTISFTIFFDVHLLSKHHSHSISIYLIPFLTLLLHSPCTHEQPFSNKQTNKISTNLLIKNILLMLGSTPRNRRQPNHRLLKTTNTVILLIDFLSLTTLLHAHL